MLYAPPKKVDNDAICLKLIVLTNLGPTSVGIIFYAPNVAILGFWKIVPTIAF